MSWSGKRQSFFIFGALAVALLLIALPLFFYFYKAPTCSDGKKNADETGIDCGGSCEKLCRNEYTPPIVEWVRSARVSEGIYNAVAYVENHNINAGTGNIGYTFKYYDKDNILLYERKGVTFIPARDAFAVFEDGVSINSRVPARVSFEFRDTALWHNEVAGEYSLAISNITLSSATSTPKISADVRNKTVASVGKTELVAIVYDTKDNAIAFSRTIVDGFDPEETVKIVFTWPEALRGEYARTEILSRILK